MKIKTILAFFLVLIISSACNQFFNTSTMESQNVTATPTMLPNVPSPSHTQLVSETATIVTDTPTPFVNLVPTKTVLKEQIIDSGEKAETCQNHGIPTDSRNEIPWGVIAYRGFAPDGLFLFSGSSGDVKNTQLSISDIGSIVGFSPKYKIFAVAAMESPTLEILTESGERWGNRLNLDELVAQIPDNATLGGWSTHRWINDDLISASVSYRDGTEVNTNRKFQVFIDPIRGTWRNDLLSSIPNIYPDSSVYYSPDMTRAVYLGTTGETKRAIKLLDYPNMKLIWENTKHIDPFLIFQAELFGTYAAWSPDSQVFAYVDAENPQKMVPLFQQAGIFLIDRDGKNLKTITNFQDQYDSYRVQDLIWSPNGQYIAFVLVCENENVRATYIYIYDIVNEQLAFTCPIHNFEHNARLFWSPDNQRIVFSQSVASPMIVYDLSNGSIIELKQNVIVGGWVDSFPMDWP